MNTDSYFISAAERNELAAYIENGDRVGFYIALHNMTGSEAALDMAEIASSSGLRGGVAWSLNSAYANTLDGYPPEGVAAFSRAIAANAFAAIAIRPDGTYEIPSDIQTYENAREVWNDVGESYGVVGLGDKYFPGNIMIARHYLEAGIPSLAWDAASMESYVATGVGVGMGLWEAFTEVVADDYNYTASLNDFLLENAGSTFETFTSTHDAELIVVKDSTGKTIGVIRGDGPFGFAGQFVDGMNHLLEPHVDLLNSLGRWAGGTLHDLLNPSATTNTSFESARAVILQRDPLVLDLDGDGLELSAASANTLFDHNADGIKTGTGWARPDDGFLVRDLNGNGSIDSGRELFGVDTVKSNGQLATQGFDALADLDANGDGQITSADAAWGQLQVWRDVNQDGISQAGELSTLDALGITRIGLNGSSSGPQAGQTLNNNRVALSTTFTRNGVNRTVGAIDLEANGFFSEIPPEVVDEEGNPVVISEAASALPQMNGSGMVRNLRAAMSLGGAQADELEAAVAAFSAAATRDEQRAQLDTLITEWAQTSSYWSSLEGYLGGSVTLRKPGSR